MPNAASDRETPLAATVAGCAAMRRNASLRTASATIDPMMIAQPYSAFASRSGDDRPLAECLRSVAGRDGRLRTGMAGLANPSLDGDTGGRPVPRGSGAIPG